MKTAAQWFIEYGESHQNPINKAIHSVCVPVITLTTIGLFWSLPSSPLTALVPAAWALWANWGTVLVFFAVLFYLRLSWILGFGMALFGWLCLWINSWLVSASSIPLWQISLALFLIAWLGQFIGHRIEGKKPSFFKDIQFLLIGPAWLLNFVYQRLGMTIR